MMRTLLAMLLLIATTSVAWGQAKPAGDPRDELRDGGKPFAYWQKFPRTELKPEWRIDAVHAMAAFGTRGYAKEATAVIVELLREYETDQDAFATCTHDDPSKDTPDQRVIRETMWALRKIGREACPILLAHLDKNALRQVAQQVYGVRWANVPISKSSIPVLLRWVDSENEEARTLAISILSVALSTEPQEMRERGLHAAFGQAVSEGKRTTAIIDKLAAQVLRWRNQPDGAVLLGALGSRAKSAVAALVRAELYEGAAGDAAQALAEIRPTAAERIPGLVVELKEGRNKEAAAKLGALGPAARAAVGDLVAALKKPIAKAADANDTIEARLAMVEALVNIAGTKETRAIVAELLDSNAVPPLSRHLMNPYLRLDNDPARVAPILTKLLERVAAGEAPEIVPTEAHSVFGYDDVFIQTLIGVLGEQGAHAAKAVPQILKAAARPDVGTRLAVITALGKIGPAAKDALPLLSQALQSPDPQSRRAAADAIAAIAKK